MKSANVGSSLILEKEDGVMSVNQCTIENKPCLVTELCLKYQAMIVRQHKGSAELVRQSGLPTTSSESAISSCPQR
jgi:hypothetical protein